MRTAIQGLVPPTRQLALAAIALIVGLAGSADPARGTIIVTAQEVGSDVVFSGSGSLNLAAWNPGTGSAGGAIFGSAASIAIGNVSVVDLYNSPTNFSGPASVGPPMGNKLGSGTGGLFGLTFAGTTLTVPENYVSGSPLSATATFSNESFASLGLTPGSYTWTWGSGASADSFTLNTIPEPSTALLLGLGITGLAVTRRRAA